MRYKYTDRVAGPARKSAGETRNTWKPVKVACIKSKWFLIKRKNDFLHLKKWQQITVLALIIPFVGLSGYKMINSYVTVPESESYKKELKIISDSISTIQETVSHGEELANTEELPKYYKNLDAIIVSCNKINKKYSSVNETAEIHKKAQATAKLCDDLRAVTIYQKNLYSQLEILTLINTAVLPAADHPNASVAVNNIGKNISQTQNNLTKITSPRFTDPALAEIINSLDDLQKRARNLQSQQNINAADYNRFIQRIDIIKKDLLLRRHYYWKNTVQIHLLEKAVRQQLDSF